MFARPGRPLPTLAVLATLAAVAPACSKSQDPARAAGAASAASSSSASVASAAEVPAAAGSGPSFASGFEGAITMRTTTAHGPSDMVFLTKGGKLRVDVAQPNGQVAHTILDPATQKLTVVMDSQRMAMQMPIPSAPPGSPSSPPTVSRTGKHETIAGYDCEDWNIVAASGNHESACVAQGLAFFDFSAMAGPTSGHSWAQELRDKNGFPLRAVETDPSGKEVSRMEVTKIEKRPLGDDTFTVPSGFNVMSVPGMMGGMASGRPVAPPHP
jgi:hypothetical protein